MWRKKKKTLENLPKKGKGSVWKKETGNVWKLEVAILDYSKNDCFACKGWIYSEWCGIKARFHIFKKRGYSHFDLFFPVVPEVK